MFGRPHLRALAERVGILHDYTDLEHRVHITGDASYVLLLEAMGYAARTEKAAEHSLRQMEQAQCERVLPPVSVVLQSALRNHIFRAHLPTQGGGHSCRIQVVEENGRTHEWDLLADTGADFQFPILLDLPPGYHRLFLLFGNQRADQCLIIVPDQCYAIAQATGGRKLFGMCANLYTLRSANNWGAGDFTDLRILCEWSATKGAAFVGLNPLHAIRNMGHEVSPYSPVSRLYRNGLYLDVEAVPEFATSAEARRRVQSADFQEALHKCRAADRIQHAEIMRLKLEVMRTLHDEFSTKSGVEASERRTAFQKFVDSEGKSLDDFATFLALEDYWAALGHHRHWQSWPQEYHDPNSAAVMEFRRTHAKEIAFFEYVQFELDRQLAQAAEVARNCGMSIGLYQDLAIGTAPGGADTWTNPGLFVEGARVGAPPDDYSRKGQDWGLPPIHPIRLRGSAYAYWRQLLRANMAHSGALRIDHVMGLLRQYWIPPGATALQGAYVKYPAADLFGILALESQRHKAVVIGEDLGTVPEGFTQLLERYGILSCEVLYFQRDAQGNFRPPDQYSRRSLVTSTTHDHPSLASFWREEDLRLRRRLGVIDSDEQLQEEKAKREYTRQALLRAVGISDQNRKTGDVPYEELCAEVHRFLAQTPAPLMGMMLDDLTGELEPINIPGVPPEKHDCWRRRMQMPMEEIMRNAEVEKSLSGTAARREAN